MQQKKAEQKKPFDWLLLIIYGGTFISDLNYSSLSSFYPVEAKNQADLSETLIGFVFAIYSIWCFLTTFLIAKLMQKAGRKKMFSILGLFLEIVGLGVFLIIKSVNDQTTYIVLSFLGRTIIGAGNGIFNSPAYSFLLIFYKDTLEEKIATLESISGFGYSIGPLFGGVLYTIGGWYTPFIVNINFCLIIILICLRHIPEIVRSKKEKSEISQKKDQQKPQIIIDETNRNQQKEENQLNLEITTFRSPNSTRDIISFENRLNVVQSQRSSRVTFDETISNASKNIANDNKQIDQNQDEEQQTEQLEISYYDILSNFQLVLVQLIFILVSSTMCFLDPTFEDWVRTSYRADHTALYTGILFFVGSLVFIVFCYITALLIRKCNNIKQLVFFGCLISGIGMILIGPDDIVTGISSTPGNLYILFIAQSIIGIGNALVYVPVIPDIIDNLQRRFENISQENLGDISSSIYNCCFSLGSFLGPAISGFLVQNFGFKRSTTFMGLMLFVLCLIYSTIEKSFCIQKYKQTSKVQVEIVNEQKI